MHRNNKKIILIFIAFVSMVGLIKGAQQHFFSLKQLNLHKHYLIETVNTHYITSVIAFIACYILFAALMLPGISILSLVGGLLFDVMQGTIYVTIGAAIGAFCAFIATRRFVGYSIQNKYHASLEQFNKAIAAHGSIYLFIVRLIPIFPFFLVNLLAGLSTVSPRTFFITTVFGVIPLITCFTYLGAQLRYTEKIEHISSYPFAIGGLALLCLLVLQIRAKYWHVNRASQIQEN